MCKRSLTPFLFLLLATLVNGTAPARADIWQIEVAGPIGPALADHTIRGIEDAGAAGASLVLLRVDTPGGLDSSMREMIQAILASPLPVVSYVAPSGARAASAGTYLLYASHIAAMAPGTNLGAATPVKIASPGLPGSDKLEGDDSPAETGSAMERKIVNDAVAYIQSLAQLRGRNAEWAEAAVREGASLSAQDALEANVVDLVASSRDELLAALDGRKVSLGSGTVTLRTGGVAVRSLEMDWRSRFLAVITNPNIAYLLMLVGFYGLILEFYNPGVGVPGVAGAVCLLLALYAFQILPVSYVGLGLIALGIGLMVAEATMPSFGILGFGGVVAFIFGSIMLMDTELPGYRIALPLIFALALFSAALLCIALGLLLKSRRRALASGLERLVGSTAVVEVIRGGKPYVRLDGELWCAESDQALREQDAVTINAFSDLHVYVRKLSGENT